MSIGKRIKSLRLSQRLTQEELANKIGVATQTIYKYENEIVTNIPSDRLESIAGALGVSPSYIMGWGGAYENIHNICPIKSKKFPMLGKIACGDPIMCEQDYETYIEASSNINADFCLTAKGDSMINARIFDGDVVFIRECAMVNNGEIAAVIIDNEATLKRVYKRNDCLILRPENPLYKEIILEREEMNSARIIGKAVAFMSIVH